MDKACKCPSYIKGRQRRKTPRDSQTPSHLIRADGCEVTQQEQARSEGWPSLSLRTISVLKSLIRCFVAKNFLDVHSGICSSFVVSQSFSQSCRLSFRHGQGGRRYSRFLHFFIVLLWVVGGGVFSDGRTLRIFSIFPRTRCVILTFAFDGSSSSNKLHDLQTKG